jgi:hypothetical protein
VSETEILRELVQAIADGDLHKYHSKHLGGNKTVDYEMSMMDRQTCAYHALLLAAKAHVQGHVQGHDTEPSTIFIDDQAITDMPEFCINWHCRGAKLEERDGYITCPECNGSYGEALPELQRCSWPSQESLRMRSQLWCKIHQFAISGAR